MKNLIFALFLVSLGLMRVPSASAQFASDNSLATPTRSRIELELLAKRATDLHYTNLGTQLVISAPSLTNHYFANGSSQPSLQTTIFNQGLAPGVRKLEVITILPAGAMFLPNTTPGSTNVISRILVVPWRSLASSSSSTNFVGSHERVENLVVLPDSVFQRQPIQIEQVTIQK